MLHSTFRWFGFCFVGLILGGCVERAATPDSHGAGNIFKDALRGIVAGQAYDRALLAQGRDDDAAYVQAMARLQESGAPDAAAWASALTLRRAEDAVWRGRSFDAVAQDQAPAAKNKWEKRALANYRRALLFAPEFPSNDPNLLNALGYTLANRGNTSQDFINAEKLTRRALTLLDKEIEKAESGPLLGQTQARALRFDQAYGPRDSLAWALFKQKRYDEALKEQQRAIADAKANKPEGLLAGAVNALPDLLYHLGAIHAARGETAKAQAAFNEALQLQPDHAEAALAVAQLEKKLAE